MQRIQTHHSSASQLEHVRPMLLEHERAIDALALVGTQVSGVGIILALN
jgi:hypothetical protein